MNIPIPNIKRINPAIRCSTSNFFVLHSSAFAVVVNPKNTSSVIISIGSMNIKLYSTNSSKA